MVRRRRKARDQAALLASLDENGGGGGAADGLLTSGDTHVDDQFSFLPPGMPSGGAGEWAAPLGVCSAVLRRLGPAGVAVPAHTVVLPAGPACWGARWVLGVVTSWVGFACSSLVLVCVLAWLVHWVHGTRAQGAPGCWLLTTGRCANT